MDNKENCELKHKFNLKFPIIVFSDLSLMCTVYSTCKGESNVQKYPYYVTD
jgi:hypothetical protein